jgi:hypothetical protein
MWKKNKEFLFLSRPVARPIFFLKNKIKNLLVPSSSPILDGFFFRTLTPKKNKNKKNFSFSCFYPQENKQTPAIIIYTTHSRSNKNLKILRGSSRWKRIHQPADIFTLQKMI